MNVSQSQPVLTPKSAIGEAEPSGPNAARNAEIIRRREAGERPRGIARAMGISASTVAGTLRRAGRCDPQAPQSSHAPRPRLAPELRADILAYRVRVRATQRATARHFGVSPHTVWRLVHSA